MKNEVTQSRLKELLEYRPEDPSGGFSWLVSRRGTAKVGTKAGTPVPPSGHRKISVDGEIYSEHRLVWLYHHGVLPDCQVDHINRNPSDNRIENLRLAVNNEYDQQQNRNVQKNNSSGVPGVHWCARDHFWVARISVGGKRRIVGYFLDYDDAVAARLQAKKKLHTFHPDQAIAEPKVNLPSRRAA